DAMILGSRALSFASRVQLEDASPETPSEAAAPGAQPTSPVAEEVLSSAASVANGPLLVVPQPKAPGGKINDIAIGGTIVLSLAFGFLIFRLLPTLMTDGAARLGALGNTPGRYLLNACDGLIRISFFFIYILLISRLAGIRAVFE